MTTTALVAIAAAALAVLAWVWLWLDNQHLRRRLDRHRAELDNHAGRLTWVVNALDSPPDTHHAPMPVVPGPQIATIPHTGGRHAHAGGGPVSPQPNGGGRAQGVYASVTYPSVTYGWGDYADTVRATDHPTMQLATTTLRRPPTVLPPVSVPASVPDALAQAGRRLTRQELADQLGMEHWALIPVLRDLVHAGAIETCTDSHSTIPHYRLRTTA